MKNSKLVFLVFILMLILVAGTQSVLAKGEDNSSSNSSGSSGKSDQSGSNSGRNGSDDSSDDSIDDNSADETDNDRQEDRQEDRQQDRQQDNDDTVITPAITTSSSSSDDGLDDSDDIKSEVKSSPKETKTSVTSDGIKTTIINKDGRFIIKTESDSVKTEEENSAETEEDNNELMKIDERLQSKGIKVSALDKDEFVIRGQDIAAITNFPLSLDFETGQLIVTTSAGQKIVTVLPDKAIENIIAANIINRLGKTQKIESIDQVIKLGEDNGLPIYEINGLSDQKLLGIIPISIKKSLVVSAQTGEVVSQNNSLLEDVLDLLSV